MALNDVFWNGYEKIWSTEAESQQEYLSAVAEVRGIPLEFIKDAYAVFIPNNEFMLHFFGPEIQRFGCYVSDSCIWENFVIFPVRNVNSEVVAFAGFAPFVYLEEDAGKKYYSYSSKEVFNKSNYLYFPQGNLRDAIEAGYLLVVDGVFDAISLCGYEFRAASMMGSNLTPGIIMQLRLVPNIVLVADNDTVGYKLFDDLKRRVQGVKLFRQDKAKDIDELLKSEWSDAGLAELNSLVASLR